jgi:transposase
MLICVMSGMQRHANASALLPPSLRMTPPNSNTTAEAERAFKVAGLTWIVERSFTWLSRNRRLSKVDEFRLQTSEATIDLAATRIMRNRIAGA